MKQIIAILLKKDKKIESVRRRNIPKKIKPHITLVYPFEAEKKKLDEHIKKITDKTNSFRISLNGVKKSAKGYYLYLLVDKGRDKVMKLYKELNKDILSGFKNKDMPRYIPHISLGVFKSKKQIDTAMKELKKEKIEFKTKVDSIHLLTIDKRHSIRKIKRFKLK